MRTHACGCVCVCARVCVCVCSQGPPAQEPRVLTQTLELPTPSPQGCAPQALAPIVARPLRVGRCHLSLIGEVAGQMRPMRSGARTSCSYAFQVFRRNWKYAPLCKYPDF